MVGTLWAQGNLPKAAAHPEVVRVTNRELLRAYSKKKKYADLISKDQIT